MKSHEWGRFYFCSLRLAVVSDYSLKSIRAPRRFQQGTTRLQTLARFWFTRTIYLLERCGRAVGALLAQNGFFYDFFGSIKLPISPPTILNRFFIKFRNPEIFLGKVTWSKKNPDFWVTPYCVTPALRSNIREPVSDTERIPQSQAAGQRPEFASYFWKITDRLNGFGFVIYREKFEWRHLFIVNEMNSCPWHVNSRPKVCCTFKRVT